MQIHAAGDPPIEDADPEPLTVLVVDDDRYIVEGLSDLLESEGYKVATATNGLDALDQLRRGLRPSVIVLDLMMPTMDGWGFRQEQMKDAELKEIPVVVMTAAGVSEGSVKTKFGDIEFLPKPSNDKAFLRAVRLRSGEATQ